MTITEKGKAYVLTLEGGGDRIIAVVSKEVYDWIKRTDTPGREGKESSWVDTAAPKSVISGGELDDEVEVTIGSFQNDRALHALHAQDTTEFGSLSELTLSLQAHNLEIAGEYDGCIY